MTHGMRCRGAIQTDPLGWKGVAAAALAAIHALSHVHITDGVE